jgi:flavin reductase (DIM6/NTAB) family NADH-FMN oxidoreductase RutF
MHHFEHVSGETLRRVAGTLATGVTVVTTTHEGRPLGCVANSVTSVSLTPPTMLVCLGRHSSTRPALASAGAFALNILPDNEESRRVCKLFAGKGAQKFADVSHRVEASGAPILDVAMSWLDCKVIETYEFGDHTIFIGAVLAAHESTAAPLVFFRSHFTSLCDKTAHPL